VQAGKTRIFHTLPFDYQILLRMYFGDFISFLQNSSDEIEIAIGINPDSKDWTRLYKQLTKFGTDTCIAGDFGAFDSSVSSQIAGCISWMANEFYADSCENENIRIFLLEMLFERYHLVEDIIHYRGTGNPSGQVMTAPLNSLFVMIFYRCCFEDLTLKSTTEFRDYVSLKVYGDDNIAGIAPSIVDVFNMTLISAWFKTKGLELTMADKSSHIISLSNISQVTFLKRSFVPHTDGYVRAPFDKEDIWAELRYSFVDANNGSDLSQIATNVQRSHFHFGRQCFDLNKKQIITVFSESGITLSHHLLKDYEEIWKDMYVDGVLPYWNL
jgi:hypothetical protein